MSNRRKNSNNKIPFSKIIAGLCLVCLFTFSIWSGIEYYLLVKLAIENSTEYSITVIPDASLAIACVTAILGVFASYCLYSFGCKNSLNKNGLEEDPLTGQIVRIPEQTITTTINKDKDNIVLTTNADTDKVKEKAKNKKSKKV